MAYSAPGFFVSGVVEALHAALAGPLPWQRSTRRVMALDLWSLITFAILGFALTVVILETVAGGALIWSFRQPIQSEVV